MTLAFALSCADEPIAIEPPLPVEKPKVLALAGADLEVLEGSKVTIDVHDSRSLDATRFTMTWSQVEGPQVSLTNPSGPAPSFIAPLAPAELRFRLRTELEGQEVFDFVTVFVRDRVSRPAFFVEAPADIATSAGAPIRFVLNTVGVRRSEVEWRVRPFCADNVPLLIEDNVVSLEAPEHLPCALLVDAVREGVRSSTVAYTIFPSDTETLAPLTLDAPLFAAPQSAFDLRAESDSGIASLVAWQAFGELESSTLDNERQTFSGITNKTRGTLVIGVERRGLGVSSGIRYARIDVGAGENNRAPNASAGSDRTVRPGETFEINSSASRDPDGDAITLKHVQVLGPTATEDPLRPGVFAAPTTTSTLLFHVTAADDNVESQPESIRVIVDDQSENQAPIFETQTEIFVQPGRAFELSMADASDPDSGFLSRYSIVQQPGDDVILLPEPSNQISLSLVAQNEGDIYNFVLSVFDEGGLEAHQDVSVHVANIGPYVDPSRGSQQGNGTPESPFASLARAYHEAARFGLAELRLSAGDHTDASAFVPRGVSLKGGYLYSDDGGYVAGEDSSRVLLQGEALVLNDNNAQGIDFVSDGENARLVLEGVTQFQDCTIVESSGHSAALVEVKGESTFRNVKIERTTSLADEEAALVVSSGATLSLQQSEVFGGESIVGRARRGIVCNDAIVDVVGSRVEGGVGDQVVALESEGCDVRLVSATLVGGLGQRIRGLSLNQGNLVMSSDSTLTALSDRAALSQPVDESIALEVNGERSTLLLRGTLQTQHPESTNAANVSESIALHIAATARSLIENATIRADGLQAFGLINSSANVQLRGSSVRVNGADRAGGITSGAPLFLIENTVMSVSGGDAFALSSNEAAIVRVRGSVFALDATSATAFDYENAIDLRVDESDVVVEATTQARGIRTKGANLFRVKLRVAGNGATGIELVDGSSFGALGIDDSEIVVSAPNARAIVSESPVVVRSSIIKSSGEAAHAIDSNAATALQHVTISAEGQGVIMRGAQNLSVQNSAISADQALSASIEALTLLATGFSGRLLLNELSPTAFFDSAPLACNGCVIFDDDDLDETCRLTAGDNPLVDGADASAALANDIDGNPRNVGAGPDIGAQERL